MSRSRLRLPRRSLRALLAASVVLTIGTSAASAQAPRRAWTSFEVVAASEGARVALFVPGGPLNDRVFEGGAPAAQARLDGLGSSTAYAAGAYPDELVLNVPGLLAGITKVPVPGYPLIVSSSDPTQPSAKLDAGAAKLEATSTAQESSASAASGGTGSPTGRMSASSKVVHEAGGTLRAEATSTVESVVIGPLAIGRITSVATARRSPDGDVVRSSVLKIEGARVGETAIEIGPGGIRLAGSNVPLPEDDPIRQQLRTAGVVARMLDDSESPTGVTAPGLELTTRLPLTLTGAGESRVTYTFGRSTVSTAGSPAGVELSIDDAEELESDVPSGGDFDSPGVENDGVIDAQASAEASVAEAAPVARPQAGRPVLRAVAEVWSGSFYAVIVLAASLLAGAALALRTWAVRGVWRS